MNKLLIVIIFLLFSSNVFSQENAINQLPARLTANKIESDNKRKKISAKGNAKFTKGGNSIFADKIEYFQTEKKITAIGDVKLDNYQMGNMSATKAEFKDNFASGKVENPALIFFDGSYIKAKDANKKKNITFLKKSIFSVCPNDQNSNKSYLKK